jgi:signal transduction histidine kinase
MNRFTLSQRLSAVFAVLLLACCAASAWLQVRANTQHAQETVQRLSSGLAQHIADNSQLMDAGGLKPEAVRGLFDKLMAVNPSVEVYLLAADGRVIGDAAPSGHLKRQRVAIEPIRRLLAGDALPIFGDDPRNDSASKVFNVAPLRVDGKDSGYVYVVLQGEDLDALAADVAASSVLRTTLWSMAVVALLCLIAGLVAFGLITRPLRRLTSTMRNFDGDGASAEAALIPAAAPVPGTRDEIAILDQTFRQMAQRLAEQWRELTRQDQQRRELVANISHDLRTPLTSLHGYLETLLVKADDISLEDRRRYLEIALGQSRKVGKLAQALFELARLESGLIQPEKERFALPDLVQDVFQKFELAAEARRLRLVADIDRDLPVVSADLAMIERVLTNLLDNAIRHSPVDSEITVSLKSGDGAVDVQISDQGPGIPVGMRATLFNRASILGSNRRDAGGLGLIIVSRILQLHNSTVRLLDLPGKGAVFGFSLDAGK